MRLFACLLMVVAASGSVGCGSSDNGPPQHLSTDGSFGFDGAGWTRDTTTKDDVWRDGDLKIFMSDSTTDRSSDARTWAERERADLSAPTLFSPTPLRSTGAYWFGWRFEEDAVNVYEYYFIDSKHRIQVEIAGPTLSQFDAEAILVTVRTL